MNDLRCLSLLAALFAGLTLTSSPVFAEDTISARDAFAALKSLAGEWTGTAGDGNGSGPATVIFSITAAGTVVQERQFPGTEHEMVSMYHIDTDRLVMTHYCAMGNQPHMALSAESTPDTFIFEFDFITNLASPDRAHMHSGRITFIDANHIEAVWDVFEAGRKIGENKFVLERN